MKDKGVNVIFEVGVGESYVCRTKRFWGNKNCDCHLFEPNPKLFEILVKQSQSFDNVTVYNVGISNENKIGEIYLADNCSFIKGVDSPCSMQEGTKQEYESWDRSPVELYTIDKYDTGNIDLLLIDTEGSEWFVLEKLI